MNRSHNPRWHRARELAALAVPLALAAGVLPASGAAIAEPATTTPTTTTTPTGSADQQHGQPLNLPGLHDDSYAVTLLTGDQVRLNAAGGGRYMVVGTPAAGHATVTVNATGGPDGVTTLQATPSAAQFLLASGQVDTGLFDIQYLAAHGYTDGANKPIPVTVQYTDHADADTLTRRAGSLPASTLTATNTQTGTADLRVDPHHAADFWAALTSTRATTATGVPPSGLAGGVAHVWLTGHRTADQTVRPDADTGQPTYPVTVTVEPGDVDSQVARCNGTVIKICAGTATLMAVDGDNVGHSYMANLVCLDHDPCTSMRAQVAVPAGIYFARIGTGDAPAMFFRDAHQQTAYVFAPEVTVERATSIDFDLSRLRHVVIKTPKPTEAYEGTVQWQRTLSNGRSATAATFSAYGFHNIWAMPSTEPVTVGAFHFSTEWVLGKPTITANVDGPQGFDLHPMYPYYNTTQDSRINSIVRFSGRQRLQVVDAGYGRPQDFASIDARGKLAVLRIGSAGPWGLSGGSCAVSSLGLVLKWQLDDALQAGAAGILIDPRNPGEEPDGWCILPIYYGHEDVDDTDPPPPVPFAAIPPDEAIRLESLLEQHDVQVTVTDGGVSPYAYNLKFYEEGDIPRSLRYDVDADQLTAVDTRYHWDTPAKNGSRDMGVWRPDEFFLGGIGNTFAVPARRTEYYGPVSPDAVVDRHVQVLTPSVITLRSAVDVFDQRGSHRTEDINARPASPGPFVYHTKAHAAQQPPTKFAQECALCRQGNTLLATVNIDQGSGPLSAGALLGSDTTHLYLGDEEIPQTSVPPGLPVYLLPPERHAYRLVTDFDNAGFGHTHVDWRFTSAAPEHNQVPPATLCHGEEGKPCQADPFVFLSYDLGVALDNTLAAPSVGQFTVTANHQASDAPAIRDLKVWTSTDDGEHWKQALVLPRGRGEHGARDFSVLTAVPPVSQTTGTLSIKAQATDAAGNSITETLTQAVKLTARTGWGLPGHLTWQ